MENEVIKMCPTRRTIPAIPVSSYLDKNKKKKKKEMAKMTSIKHIILKNNGCSM
jgi:hypothetical protein